jgi:hypothetical protein
MTEYRAGILAVLNIYDSRYVQWCLPPGHRIAAVRSPGIYQDEPRGCRDDYLIEGASLLPVIEGEVSPVMLILTMHFVEPDCELIGAWAHDLDTTWRIDRWPSTDGFAAAMDTFAQRPIDA